jgi:hypothetical protein
MWNFTIKGKCSLMKSILTQLKINCYIKFFWYKYYYYPTVLSSYFTCLFCSQFILQPSASKFYYSKMLIHCSHINWNIIQALFFYVHLYVPCLWISLDSFHHILNNALVIFSLMSCGWLHTRTLPRVYETHGIEQGWEVVNPLPTTHHWALFI